MTCRQCYQLCFEGDPQSIQKTERWKYVGEGRGSYDEQSRLTYVGLGKGNIDKELPRTSGGPNCYLCTTLLGVLMLVTLGLLFWLYLRAAHPPAHAELYDCFRSYETQFQLWDARHRDYCCDNFGRGCAHFAPSPPVPHRVPHRVPQHRAVVHHVIYRKPPSSFAFDCHSGYSNWYFGWSTHKKSWCCDHRGMGCPGTWHGSHHVHTHVMAHGVGHAKGRIYDCDAGFSRWMTGWSDSKKDWCCHHQSRGCVKFHCTGVDSSWAEAKRSWCCRYVQKGCPRTTLSPLKCKTPCTLKGQTSTCLERIQWVTKNTYSGKEAACNLAYSRVQVECDVCRGCSIQEAGCEVHAGKDPFDCNAALNNFFRAWSPEKKHWCCTKQGKGCEGSSPPSVDPGFGMIWKHVQVNGYWTWQTVHAAGGVHTKLPYDCHAGLNNWQSGWSGPKKSWCCSHQQLGCGGAATDVQSGSWNHGGDHIVHHVVHHVYHYRSRGSPSIPR